MKRFILFLFAAVSSIGASAQFIGSTNPFTSQKNSSINEEACYYQNSHDADKITMLFGKVYRAKKGEPYDLVVRVANEDEYAEMVVGIVKKKPDECGLWQWTDNRKEADFSVRIIKSGPCHIIVEFCDGESMRTTYDGIPCAKIVNGKAVRIPCD